MFACICRAVTSDEVGAAIDNGAATVAAVAKATRACTSCGMCRDRIRGMLGEGGRPRVAETAAAPAA
ncbi:MAG: (2Fe-2S)-binding protein [Trebonia sp.]